MDCIVVESKRVKKEFFKDFYRYRELFYFLALRDILVRYKQAFFGIAWALIRPLLQMTVFALIFGKVANLSSGNINYACFVLSGLLPWQFFSSGIADSSGSLVANANLLNKVYFPRIMIPIVSLVIHFIDFFVAFSFMLIFLIFSNQLSWSSFILFPFFLMQLVILSVGLSCLLSSLTVKYRDFRFIVPFFLQFGMFLSPVGYGTFLIEEKVQWLYFLNPLVGIIDGFRWSLFAQSYPNMLYSISISVVITVLVLFIGIRYFYHTEQTFADQV